MSGPFVFIGTHSIREGKLEEFQRDCQNLAEVVQEKEPQLLVFAFYFNEDRTEVSTVQVHPDADSMLLHMQTVREHIEHAVDEQLITKDIQIFGTPNDAVSGMIAQLSQEGVPVIVKPIDHAGFART
jgi:hypothetical protein